MNLKQFSICFYPMQKIMAHTGIQALAINTESGSDTTWKLKLHVIEIHDKFQVTMVLADKLSCSKSNIHECT